MVSQPEVRDEKCLVKTPPKKFFWFLPVFFLGGFTQQLVASCSNFLSFLPDTLYSSNVLPGCEIIQRLEFERVVVY